MNRYHAIEARGPGRVLDKLSSPGREPRLQAANVGASAVKLLFVCSCCVGGACSCWPNQNPEGRGGQIQRVQRLAPQRAILCTTSFHSSCFYGLFGQPIRSRKSAASPASPSARSSINSPENCRRRLPMRSRSCAANTALNSCSTSSAMQNRNGGAVCRRLAVLATCAGSLPSNSGASRNWRWRSIERVFA